MKDAAELCRGLLLKARSDRIAMQASLAAGPSTRAVIGGLALSKCISLLIGVLLFAPLEVAGNGQDNSEPVAQTLAKGDAFFNQKNFEKARDAYHKADKLSHHSCAECLLRLFTVDRQTGELSAALDDAKRAVKAASDDKPMAAQAHLARATLLGQMSGKPGDKKLREAEDELREALALDPGQAIAHFDLGIVLIKQERDNDGITELKNYLAAPGADAGTVNEARRIILNPVRAREPFAPDFSFATQEGETISNGTLRGKVVLLDFWGVWCGPCRESVPILVDIRKKYLNRPFQMVGVSSDEDQQTWRSFIAANRMDWSEYIDLSGKVQQVFKIDAFPTYIILDRDGVIRFRQSGLSEMSQAILEDAINKALKRPSDPTITATNTAPATLDNGPAAGQNPAPTRTKTKAAPSSADATDVADGATSGGVYRNTLLGLVYKLPQAWVAATPETLRGANDKAEASARAIALQQHPELGDSLRIMVPKTIFYASRTGQGDGQHLAIPCVRISAVRWNGPELTLDAVKSSAEKMNSQGMSLVRTPEEYTAGNRTFFRADFENTQNKQPFWLSRFQTEVEGYLVMLDVITADEQELKVLALTAQLISFEKR